MLESERRRQQRRQQALRVARRERLEQCDKWKACPNQGKPAPKAEDGDWEGINGLVMYRAAYKDAPNGYVIECKKCDSKWSTVTANRHP